MTRIHRILALLLAVLWLPAALHCSLEGAGDEVSSCCSHASGDGGATAGMCLVDHCGVFSEGHVRLHEPLDELSLPVVILVACLPWATAEELAPADSVDHSARAKTPSALREWVFVRRAALYPNAPATVS